MPSLIKLDYDMSIDVASLIFVSGVRKVQEIVGLTIEDFEATKSRDNWHVRVKIKEDLMPLEILAIQLIMGSDHIREAFNLRRIRRGQKNWNILFTE